ncbi:MAG: YggS family pyridoxal phosphate-dependent enzyme [Ferruginibacter sp.]
MEVKIFGYVKCTASSFLGRRKGGEAMSINTKKYQEITEELNGKATLVAVSKTKPVEDILELYNLGQRDFGENYVQELVGKYEQLPKDIRWHYIGHLQSNKVKYIAPFVHLIHGVDSLSLLKEVNKQALKNNRTIDCLLQIHIAKEETKFGLDSHELDAVLTGDLTALKNIRITGLMGMASFSTNMDLVRAEFNYLKSLFDKYAQLSTIPQGPSGNLQLSTLSMGMSADFEFAIAAGSNMVRIGSLVFGNRN